MDIRDALAGLGALLWSGHPLLQFAFIVFVLAIVVAAFWRLAARDRARVEKIEEKVALETIEARLSAQVFALKGKEIEVAALTETITRLSEDSLAAALAHYRQKRDLNDVEGAITAATNLLHRLTPAATEAALGLARFHVALAVDGDDAGHLEQAERLARLAAAADPDGGASVVADELARRRADRTSQEPARGSLPPPEELLRQYLGDTDAGNEAALAALVTRLRHSAAELAHRGWPHSALAVLERAAQVGTRAFGATDPRTLTAHGDAAKVMLSLDRYQDAEALLNDLLPKWERVAGDSHPTTLETRRQLIIALANQDRHADAERVLRAQLKLQEDALGVTHPDMLSTRHVLAGNLYRQGRWQEAEELWRAVLAVRQRDPGPDHPDTLLTLTNVAASLTQQERWSEAATVWADAVAAYETTRGPEDRETLAARFSHAQVLARLGRHDEAIAMLEEVVAGRTKVFGDDHPDTRRARETLNLLRTEVSAVVAGDTSPPIA